MNSINLVSSNDLESKKVLDTIGHEFGKIKDTILDPITGKILLLVISKGGFAGTELGSNYYVVPWHLVQVNPNTHTCLLNLDRETMDNAPKVTYGDLLDGKRETVHAIYNYFGFPENREQENRKLENIATSEAVKDRHNAVQGSEKETKNVPDKNSNLSQEMDFDKLTGKSDK